MVCLVVFASEGLNSLMKEIRVAFLLLSRERLSSSSTLMIDARDYSGVSVKGLYWFPFEQNLRYS